ncbi:MAG: tRNA preQ1(34) S-adenosylmethionine ribosyltransferase-isomerase QueA [Gemmatimonadetes bacterium]|nr:tRNA preQ1(34) S-adenosylmethionine ribosyltransferase-isomerase QueA [Gemmatimonadota bacterium]
MNPAPDTLPTAAFEYDLPPDRIARSPAPERDASRLLILDRATGHTTHQWFRDLPAHLAGGDVLVLNETRVFRARFLGRKPSGARVEVLLLRRVAGQPEGTWEAMVRPGRKLKPGRSVLVADDFRIDILDTIGRGARIVRLSSPLSEEQTIRSWGHVPLPPYIDRDATEDDAERYQTVYARETGSVAAPTAGLHFTEALLEGLEAGGVRIARLVLHVGPGTFRPVETEDPAEHRLHAEPFELSDEAAGSINDAKSAGGRVWAVGTTVTRTLETLADADGRVRAGSGETELFIRPPYRFRIIDGLITNFHLPRSTLLMLVCAFGGYEAVMRAYREAVEHEYRFYSYGDCMLIR